MHRRARPTTTLFVRSESLSLSYVVLVVCLVYLLGRHPRLGVLDAGELHEGKSARGTYVWDGEPTQKRVNTKINGAVLDLRIEQEGAEDQ